MKAGGHLSFSVSVVFPVLPKEVPASDRSSLIIGRHGHCGWPLNMSTPRMEEPLGVHASSRLS